MHLVRLQVIHSAVTIHHGPVSPLELAGPENPKYHLNGIISPAFAYDRLYGLSLMNLRACESL
jgi:23S rRNA maturation-related 3'-5' exoribonuclease YhaM